MSVEEEIPVQDDRVPSRLIFWVFAGTIIAITVSIFTVWVLQGQTLEGGGRTHLVDLRQVPPATPFIDLTPLEARRAAQQLELDRGGWADRQRGIVRLPVAAAIDLYLQQRGGK